MKTMDEDMKLPEDKTCVECLHFKNWCSKMYGVNETNTHCDFYPIRFYTNR